jgi:hypothetical protein
VSLGPDPRAMKRLGLEEEVLELRAQVRSYRRQHTRREEEMRQDMALGKRCPRCGGTEPLRAYDVCGPCAEAMGWER